MGYNYSKRLSLLRTQTDESLEGRIGLFRTAFLAVLAFHVLAFLIPIMVGPDIVPQDPNSDREISWRESLTQGFEHRTEWLRNSPFSIAPGASKMYSAWSQSVVSIMGVRAAQKEKDKAEETESILSSLFSWKEKLSRVWANALLRAGFVIIAFWPFWVIGFLVGFYCLRSRFIPKKTDDFLGVCDRGRTPFYSGIYGPLRLNNNMSGIDISAPGLACPSMVPTVEASKHKLHAILQDYRAVNSTNVDLIRVILNYREFPCLVETEMSAQAEEPNEGFERVVQSSVIPFVTNAAGTIESSALDGLPAVLEAHALLKNFVALIEQQGISIADLHANFGKHVELLATCIKTQNPLVKLLVNSITPNRAMALGKIPAHIIATAYLSTEAGKCLVFKRHEKAFQKISHYPHLQARAILQSLVSYHKEHKGEARLMIRQALISSRRHGDFGRAFLPERMSVESRGIRDWLEIMYSEPSKRESTAHLVELDGHVEEVHINWRVNYSRRVRAWTDQEQLGSIRGGEGVSGPPYPFWKGLVYKSVILVPLSDLVSMALRGIDDARITRMVELIRLTRRTQFNLSVMARLPGFKRLAMEMQTTLGENNPYFSLGGREELLKRWTVLKRVLTHYNWLSTRVGDYSVPLDGLVHCIARFPDDANPQNRMFPFEVMVPFRQRRCDEMFGKHWEQSYYYDSPHPSQVDVFVDRNKYLSALVPGSQSAFHKNAFQTPEKSAPEGQKTESSDASNALGAPSGNTPGVTLGTKNTAVASG